MSLDRFFFFFRNFWVSYPYRVNMASHFIEISILTSMHLMYSCWWSFNLTVFTVLFAIVVQWLVNGEICIGLFAMRDIKEVWFHLSSSPEGKKLSLLAASFTRKMCFERETHELSWIGNERWVKKNWEAVTRWKNHVFVQASARNCKMSFLCIPDDNLSQSNIRWAHTQTLGCEMAHCLP